MPPSHIGLLGSWIEMHVPMLWTSHHLYSKTIIIFFPLGYTSKELSVVLFPLRNFFGSSHVFSKFITSFVH